MDFTPSIERRNVVYIHWKSLTWLARRAPPHRRPTLRRGVALMTGAAIHGSLWPLANIARGLDHVFFPAFRDTEVKGPLFVVATPRSGTTFLHHLLALDENRFTHLKLYQTVFPSVVTNKLVELLGSAEAASRVPFSAPVRWINRRMFRSWDGIHQVGLDAEEEDESLFVYALATPALFLLWPFVDTCPELKNIDQFTPSARTKIARDYRRTVQRHLYSRGRNRRGGQRLLLIKNVLLPSRMETTKMAFPDAKFIRLVRDPVSAIPSAMSLFTTQWAGHSPDIGKCSPETRALGEMFLEHYRVLCEQQERARPGSFVTVHFEDLVRDPISVIEHIYSFFGWELSAEYRRALQDELSRTTQFKSRHGYELSDYGWEPEDVRERLQDYLEDLGYAPGVFEGRRPGEKAAAEALAVPSSAAKRASLAASSENIEKGREFPSDGGAKGVAGAAPRAYGQVK